MSSTKITNNFYSRTQTEIGNFNKILARTDKIRFLLQKINSLNNKHMEKIDPALFQHILHKINTTDSTKLGIKKLSSIYSIFLELINCKAKEDTIIPISSLYDQFELKNPFYSNSIGLY
jgi:hypothetical protein